MISQKPYVIPAIYQWIVDNGWTPHIMVNAMIPGVQVPQEYVNDGRIALNVSPGAVQDFLMADGWLSFNARFSGKPMQVSLPMSAVLAIYARENDQGMALPPEPEDTLLTPDADKAESSKPRPDPEPGKGEGADSKDKSKKGPHLKVIK